MATITTNHDIPDIGLDELSSKRRRPAIRPTAGDRTRGRPVRMFLALAGGGAVAAIALLAARSLPGGLEFLAALAGTSAFLLLGLAALAASAAGALTWLALGGGTLTLALTGAQGTSDLIAVSFLLHGIAGAVAALPAQTDGMRPSETLAGWAAFNTALALLLIVIGI